eukprot:XP_001705701.1 Hypothetical protein GL50803_21906 [Giardia lamblia ATCC 50803]
MIRHYRACASLGADQKVRPAEGPRGDEADRGEAAARAAVRLRGLRQGVQGARRRDPGQGAAHLGQQVQDLRLRDHHRPEGPRHPEREQVLLRRRRRRGAPPRVPERRHHLHRQPVCRLLLLSPRAPFTCRPCPS